jgi:FlaA1/EpsC-like NDP-sugar epimerase
MVVLSRRFAQLALDLALAVAAWGIAYVARFNVDVAAIAAHLSPVQIAVCSVLQVVALAALGNYSRLWRYTSLSDLRLLVMGVVFGTTLVLALVVGAPRYLVVPRGVLLGQPFFFLVLLSSARVAWRILKEGTHAHETADQFGDPIIVVGAGKAAFYLLNEFHRSRRWRVVTLLDDDPTKQRSVIHGVRVTGTTDDFARESARFHVKKAVIAIPSLSDTERTELARKLSAQGAEVYTLPPLDLLHRGDTLHGAIRRVRLEELLRRAPVVLDRAPLRQGVEGKVVLVTGAGGSIGSELCRQVASLHPRLLVLFELSEFALYQISEELRESWCQIDLATVIGDVKDEHRLEEVMSRYRPQIVFHAAAYKHVPMMERANSFEAIKNNALGSMVVAAVAVRTGVERLVVISTDKAVNPTNVMGATKRLAELLAQKVAAGTNTKLSIVRFGNVLGSTGSVIPKFIDQIQRGGPVTVTHPEINRYFMSIPEAAQLVMLSSTFGRGGEVFVLDMGEPVRIVELAEDLIRLMGKSRHDIGIVYTGLRPGEKLYEELLFDHETTLKTEHPRIRVARTEVPSIGVRDLFVSWLREKPTRSDFEVREFLRKVVPEYTPDSRHGEVFERVA